MPRIIINSTEAKDLKDTIINAIEEEGLPTWQIRTDKEKDEFLTHTGQWIDRALLRLKVYDNRLEIIAVRWNGREEDVYPK